MANISKKVVGNSAKSLVFDSDPPSFDKYKVESSPIDQKPRREIDDDVIFEDSPIIERDWAIDNEDLLEDIVNYDTKENITYDTTLDLSKYQNLTTVKVGNIEGTLILPASVTEFECADVTNIVEEEKKRIARIKEQVERDEKETDSEVSCGPYDRKDLDDMERELAKKDPSKIPTIDLRNCIKLTTLKVGNIEGTMSLFLPNPSVIKNVEFQNISSGNTLDLTSCSSLTTLKAKKIKRNLKLPVNIESFACKTSSSDIPSSTHCSKLKILKVGTIDTMLSSLKVSTSIENFECENVTHPLDLNDPSSKLKTVKVGCVGAKIELPATVESFECRAVGYQSPLDLSHCSNLTTVKMGSIERIPTLPPSVKIFQYVQNICLAPSPIDLRHCSNLTMVKVGQIEKMGPLLLPLSKVKLKCRNVVNQTLDLTKYTSLSSVELGNISNIYQVPFLGGTLPLTATAENWLWLCRYNINKTSIKLPANITHFVCQDIQYGTTVDLSQCISPLTVRVNGNIEGTLKLPTTTTSFECGDISYSTTYLGMDLRDGAAICGLEHCKNLTTFMAKKIYGGALKLPNSVISFECQGIYSGGVVDLSQCENIVSVSVKYYSGTLILPRTGHDYLVDIPWNGKVA